jgi:DNA-binding transcriptional MerR regulator
VKISSKKNTSHVAKTVDINVAAAREYRLITLNEKLMAKITVHPRHLHTTIQKIKFFKHAKRLGFNLTEIRKFLVFWNK